MATSTKKNFKNYLKQNIRSLLFVEIIFGMIVSVSSFLVLLKLTREVLEKEGIHIDTGLSHSAYAIRDPLLTDVMKSISLIGGEVLVTASVGIVILLLVKKHQNSALLFGFTVSAGYVLNSLIKLLLRVPRPTIDPLIIEQYFSFPSGHAMNSFIFFAMVTYFFYILTKKRIATIFVGIFSGIFVLLIGFSRIYLGVHYPSDIIAGYIAGFWWVATVILLDRVLRFYHLYRRS